MVVISVAAITIFFAKYVLYCTALYCTAHAQHITSDGLIDPLMHARDAMDVLTYIIHSFWIH